MSGKWVEKEQSQDGRINFTEVGQEVIGRLKSIDDITIFDRRAKRATVVTKEGVKTFLLTTQLENLINGVPVGTIIKVRYIGERKTQRGARMKVFKLWTLEEEKKPEPKPKTGENLSWLNNPDEF